MIVSFTGHRPPKAGLTWGHEGPGDLLAVNNVREWLLDHVPSRAIVGGALGFDTLAARACYMQRVPYTVYVPFTGQDNRWPDAAKARYAKMLALADAVVVVSPGGFTARKMQVRNEAMVDRADHVLAWWDGSPGGTYNCLGYAKGIGVPVTNLYTQ